MQLPCASLRRGAGSTLGRGEPCSTHGGVSPGQRTTCVHGCAPPLTPTLTEGPAGTGIVPGAVGPQRPVGPSMLSGEARLQTCPGHQSCVVLLPKECAQHGSCGPCQTFGQSKATFTCSIRYSLPTYQEPGLPEASPVPSTSHLAGGEHKPVNNHRWCTQCCLPGTRRRRKLLAIHALIQVFRAGMAIPWPATLWLAHNTHGTQSWHLSLSLRVLLSTPAHGEHWTYQ